MKNNLRKAIYCILLVPVIILIVVLINHPVIHGLGGNISSVSLNILPLTTAASSSTSPKPILLDPNPLLIDKGGNLKNDITQAANIKVIRNGTVADGVSKLLILVPYTSKLQFSIKDRKPDNLTDGTLSPLINSGRGQSTQSYPLLSSVAVDSQRTRNGASVVIAVYTPPTSFDQLEVENKIIHVVVNDPNNPSFGAMEVPIQIHKLPIVLVHGIWESSNDTWISTNFTKALENNSFKVYFADYTSHYAETFDPYKIPKIGNYGIDSINKTISTILTTYHLRSIADSQVDIVGHSMGGLMARGYTQQSYYKNENNYMKGYVHRLITIGTPHYGAPLSTYLHDFSGDEYCFDSNDLSILFTSFAFQCPILLPHVDILDLKTIYNNKYLLPIDDGGIDALIPGSIAYSHMCPTNVKSYAIVGSWGQADANSQSIQQWLFRNITRNIQLDLDRDVFHGQNDLLVSAKSQAGGLPTAVVHLGQPLPDKSALYTNTIHAVLFPYVPIALHDPAETTSHAIQQDVAILLTSPDNKFADAIGIGSECHVPTHP